MTLFINQDFDAGPDGVAVGTANTGASSVSGVGATPNTAPEFDSAQLLQGPFSMRFITPVADTSVLRYIPASAKSLAWFSFYIRPTANPTANISLGQWWNGVTPVLVGALRWNADGSVALRDGSTNVVTSSVPLPLNTWSRISWRVQPGSSTGHQLRLYLGANRHGSTPDFNGQGAATAAAQTTFDLFIWGIGSNQIMDFNVDRLRADDATEPGPLAVDPPPVVSAGSDLTVDVGSANFTITGTATPTPPATILSRLWAYVSGVTVTLTGTGTATVTVTPPATAGTTVLSFTATDANGTATPDPVSITWLAPGRKLYPSGDVSTGTVTAIPAVTPTSANLDETTPNPSDRVVATTPNGTESRWRLPTASAPATTDDVILNVYIWVDGATTQSTRIRLYDSDGTSVRAVRTFTDLPAYTEAQVNAGLTGPQMDAALRQVILTAPEAASITGWLGGLVVGWAPTVT